MAGTGVGRTRARHVAGSLVGAVAAVAFGWSISLLARGECGTGRPGVPECGPELGQGFALLAVGGVLLFVALGVGGGPFVLAAFVGAGGIGALANGADALGTLAALAPVAWLVSVVVVGWRRLRTRLALRRGVEAVVTMLAVEPTGRERNDHPEVRVRMRVEPLFGIAPPYETARTMVVNAGEVPEAGDRYPVRVHPDDPHELHFAVAEQGYVGNPSTLRKVLDAAREGVRPGVTPMPSRDVVREMNALHELRVAGEIDLDEYTRRVSDVINAPIG